MAKYSTTQPIMQAIANMEGFYAAGTPLARVNNNPGNIRFWATRYPTNRGYTVFGSVAEGWAALEKLVDDYTDGRYHGGRPPTLRQWFAVYAPAADSNDPAHYAQYVASRTGIPIDAVVRDYAQGGGSAVSLPPITGPTDAGVLPTDGGSDSLELPSPEQILLLVCVLGLAFVLIPR